MVSIKERELIIYQRKKGRTVSEISEILGIKRSSVGFWVKKYKDTKTLEDSPRSGRPTSLSQSFLDKMAHDLKKKLAQQDKNERAGFNSKEILAILEQKTKKRYSLRHVQRILHKMGFSLITPRVDHIRKDPEKIKQFREEFKKKLPQNMWIIQ